MGFVTDALGITSRDPQSTNIKNVASDAEKLKANIDETDYNAPLAGAIAGLGQVGGGADYANLTGALNAQMAGTGPSVAQNQLNEATGANVKRSNAMAASMKGVNPALAAMMGVNAGQEANQLAAGQAATLRAGEQTGARGELANVLNQQANQKNQNLSTLGTLLGNQTARKIQNQQQANAASSGINQANTELAQKNQENRGKGISGAISGVASVAGLGTGGGGGGGAESGAESGAGGGMGETPMMAAHGGMIPGDHAQNDVVPAMLSPGEIVLPRSIVQSPDAAAQAKAFVEAIKKSDKGKK